MFHKRLVVLWVFIALAMLVIVGKLFYLQVIRYDDYRELAENKITYRDDLDTRRGMILDRRGEKLAVDEIEWDARIYLDRLSAMKDPRTWCVEFAKLVDMDGDELIAAVAAAEKRVEELASRRPRFHDVDLRFLRQREQTVLEGLDAETRTRIELGQDRLPQYETRGKTKPVFALRDTARRTYPFGPVAAHVVGYMGAVSPEEFRDRGYRYSYDGDPLKKFKPDDPIGRTGVEAAFEPRLRGARGLAFGFCDVHGSRLSNLPSTRIEPKFGRDVSLALDARLQQLAEQALDGQIARLDAKRQAEDPPIAGAVVLLDPRTGDVLAAASFPRYNLNAVTWSMKDLSEDPRAPLWFRATRGRYPLGSVFKIIVAVAGLEDGVLNGHTEFTCAKFFRKWGEDRQCTGTHGPVEMSRAIEQSCNIYFYEAGLRVGGAQLKSWAEKFGLGRKTGAEIAESAGFVPTSAGRSETLNLAIGQGRLVVTPLQAARVMGAVALEGRLADARFTLNTPVRVSNIDLHPDRLGVVRWGMHDVVNAARGTAHATGEVEGLDYAGKTGTAQTPRVDIYHAWYAGFAPFREPRIAFACVIENTRGHGGADATPVIRDIFSAMTQDPALAGYLSGKEIAP